jgi:sugar/nucleoside kinase (ribokinase family)
VALTAGKDGCALACASGSGEVCCVTQAAVELGAPAQDTTGAGDAFLG